MTKGLPHKAATVRWLSRRDRRTRKTRQCCVCTVLLCSGVERNASTALQLSACCSDVHPTPRCRPKHSYTPAAARPRRKSAPSDAAARQSAAHSSSQKENSRRASATHEKENSRRSTSGGGGFEPPLLSEAALPQRRSVTSRASLSGSARKVDRCASCERLARLSHDLYDI